MRRTGAARVFLASFENMRGVVRVVVSAVIVAVAMVMLAAA